MDAFTQIALLFGGIIAAGLFLTFLHDLLERHLEAGRARQRNRAVLVKPAVLPKSESVAPILTVRLRSEAQEESASFPKAA